MHEINSLLCTICRKKTVHLRNWNETCIIPGQLINAGTLIPPSQVVPFPHRRRPPQPPWFRSYTTSFSSSQTERQN